MERELREELMQLQKIVEQVNGRLKKAPKGHLHVRKKRGYTEYYYRAEKQKEKYVRKQDLEIAKGIAQRDSVKNHADAMIFHTAICAAGATNSKIAEPNLIFGSRFLRRKASAEWRRLWQR